MATYNSFEELDCWKKCRELRIWLDNYILKRAYSQDRDMYNNLSRAARSTTRNIAEGFGRFHYKENIQFCRISRGSLFEIKDDLYTCMDRQIGSQRDLKIGFKLLDIAIHSLNGYIRYLRTAKARN